jgi:transcriptional regulator with PAS, ATPase and Fis domain
MIAGRRLEQENRQLKRALKQRYSFPNIIGKSERMLRMLDLVTQVATSRSTILITGETGTGKEVVSRAIHHNSPRRANRFVALNCSAIPETLLEAELFGHVRGAFTGAVGNRQGRLEQAHKGTLFLDEVGTMSTALQMKLLRVLQEREFERVGDSHTIKVDVRVIAATNSDLGRLVAEGQFREDLFYRLNVIPVQLPALRERKEDVPLLTQHFLQKYAIDRPPLTASQEAMRRLMAYPWPGNVRQLENWIERAIVLARADLVDVAHFPPVVRGATAPPLPTLPRRLRLREVEKLYILETLEQTRWNRAAAARLLGISVRGLQYKLQRYLGETRSIVCAP